MDGGPSDSKPTLGTGFVPFVCFRGLERFEEVSSNNVEIEIFVFYYYKSCIEITVSRTEEISFQKTQIITNIPARSNIATLLESSPIDPPIVHPVQFSGSGSRSHGTKAGRPPVIP